MIVDELLLDYLSELTVELICAIIPGYVTRNPSVTVQTVVTDVIKRNQESLPFLFLAYELDSALGFN